MISQSKSSLFCFSSLVLLDSPVCLSTLRCGEQRPRLREPRHLPFAQWVNRACATCCWWGYISKRNVQNENEFRILRALRCVYLLFELWREVFLSFSLFDARQRWDDRRQVDQGISSIVAYMKNNNFNRDMNICSYLWAYIHTRRHTGICCRYYHRQLPSSLSLSFTCESSYFWRPMRRSSSIRYNIRDEPKSEVEGFASTTILSDEKQEKKRPIDNPLPRKPKIPSVVILEKFRGSTQLTHITSCSCRQLNKSYISYNSVYESYTLFNLQLGISTFNSRQLYQ